jgi:4-hydroxythreonine-4-phosphate dehydrogenase
MPSLRRSKTNNQDNKPGIILTTGDPNGIGPEIILKIFSSTSISRKFRIKIAGDKRVYDSYAGLLGMNEIPERFFETVKLPKGYSVKAGSIDSLSGRHSGDCIKHAVKLCMKKNYDAMVTLPISKEAFILGGYNYPGHTEMITALTRGRQSLMMMYSNQIIVSLVTNHLPISKVSKAITQELIVEKFIISNNSLVRDLGIMNPRIALLSLNPHNGDGGNIGKEELKVIMPAIEKLRNVGFNVSGPLAADAFFAGKNYERFDMILAMYHDQGLIPFKMISVDSGVNFTAGLKIVRTSPDHGTAFDIAGMGIAIIQSTVSAIETAVMIAANRNRGLGLSSDRFH